MTTTTDTTGSVPIVRTLPETLHRLRGHNFTPSRGIASQIPALYATESTERDEKAAFVKYYSGGWTWFVIEMDWAEGEAFGYEIGPGGEGLTYIPLADLEGIRPNARAEGAAIRLSWVIERDTDFKPKTLGEALADYRREHGL